MSRDQTEAGLRSHGGVHRVSECGDVDDFGAPDRDWRLCERDMIRWTAFN
jgi:hypothetical protein